jgi:trk system potassium uptake protein
MHYPIIFRLLGAISQVLTLAFVVCLGVALFFGDGFTVAVRGFGVSGLIAAALSGGFYLLGRNAKVRLFRKEALCIIGVGWIIASVLGSLPYWTILRHCNFVDAIFESVSGFTTTGATVFTDYEHTFPPSLLFWRSLSQWIGGLGVVVLFVAIVSNVGSGAKVLFSNESSGHSTDIEDGTIKQGAKRIMNYYISISLAAWVCYYFAGLSWFDAFCHAATTVSTGGFSTINAGVPGFNSPKLEWFMILFMFLGGFSFMLALRLLKSGWKAAKMSLEGVVYTILFVGVSFILAVINYITLGQHQLGELVRDACFQVITIMTTTGYATEDFNQWSFPAKWILLGLMVIGGCSSSTAGGIKVIRLVAAFRMARQSVEKTFRVNVIRPLRLNGIIFGESARESLSSFLILTALVSMIGIMGFSILQPSCDMETGISAVFACLFNIGPGLGQVGPTENFAFLHDATKIGLSVLMLLGRLELYALLVLFSPSLWRKFS